MSQSQAAPAVELRGLTKHFGDEDPAVNEVSLAIQPQEFVTVVGPSGCGKSTLLRLIAGLETPTAGQIWLHGQDASGLPPEKRHYGIVFQSYALFPNLTVAANVGYGLRKLSRKARQQRVEGLLGRVGLDALAHRYPHQLSGGQKQRAALARALSLEASLLLLDEPFSALDPQVRTDLRRHVRQIHDSLKLTTILVTHDQQEALSLSDRVVVMQRGRIEQLGTPQQVYAKPATPFSAGFVGPITWLEPATLQTLGLSTHATERVGIRPEHVLLTGRGQQGSLSGTVAQRAFLGATQRLDIQLTSGQHVLADVPATDLVQVGESLSVSIDASQCIRLPFEAQLAQ